MNLKIKFKGETFKIPDVESITFSDFKQIVAAQCGINTEFFLTYGNQEEILLDSNQTMNMANLVSGDIVYVKMANENSPTSDKRVHTDQLSAPKMRVDEPPSNSIESSDIRNAISNLFEQQRYIRDTITSFPLETPQYIFFSYHQMAGGRRFNIRLDLVLFRNGSNEHGLVNFITITGTVSLRNNMRLAVQVNLHQGILVQRFLNHNLLRPIHMTIQGWENEENSFLQTIMNLRLVEITSRVLSYLQPRDVVHLERTCSTTLTTCRDPFIDRRIWKNFLREKFGEAAVQEAIRLRQTFCATYILHAQAERERAENRERFIREQRRQLHPYWPWPNGGLRPNPNPVNPIMPPINPLNPRPYNPDPDVNPFAPGIGGMIYPNPRPSIDPSHPRIYPYMPSPDQNPDPDAPQMLPRPGYPYPQQPGQRQPGIFDPLDPNPRFGFFPSSSGRGRGGGSFDPNRFI